MFEKSMPLRLHANHYLEERIRVPKKTPFYTVFSVEPPFFIQMSLPVVLPANFSSLMLFFGIFLNALS